MRHASPPPPERPRLAISNDQLGDLGGTERVLDAIVRRHPAALLVAPRFAESGLDDDDVIPWPNPRLVVPAGRRKAHLHAPIHARRLARLPVDADVVVALTQMGTATFVGPGSARRIVYSAGLPRPLHVDFAPYASRHPWPTRLLAPALLPLVRRWYVGAIRRADRLLVNSAWSAGRVERVTGVAGEVLHPPVRTAFFTPAAAPRSHVLVVARLVPHKLVDVVVEAFRGLDRTLVVAGGGPELGRLRASAPPNVHLPGRVTDEELRQLYRSSEAVVCPSVEEFGIVMAEALACGAPVVAPRDGGALEIVEDGRTGVLLDRVEPRSIVAALEALRTLSPPPAACRASVERFAEEAFLARLDAVIEEEAEIVRAARSRGASATPGPARSARQTA